MVKRVIVLRPYWLCQNKKAVEVSMHDFTRMPLGSVQTKKKSVSLISNVWLSEVDHRSYAEVKTRYPSV